jgi:archaellum component FlaC
MAFRTFTKESHATAMEELQERFKKERQEYEMKIRKLNDLYAEGLLPDTPFVDSFIPRVTDKFNADIIPLTAREKEVIDDMFNKY